MMRYHSGMRTTLELDDDLLAEAKQMARQRGESIGQVISALARQALSAEAPVKVRNGVLLFAPKDSGAQPDLRTVNALRDDG